MKSEQINELMAALAKAQGEMRPALKDSTNPHFRSRFADLASVWDACREPLSKHGLAIVQSVVNKDGEQYLETTLGHSSGQWISSEMRLPIQKPGPQELGSCLSYCRRYSLAAIVGVYQDDDDGEKGERLPLSAPGERPQTNSLPAPAKVSPNVATLSAQMIQQLNPYFAEDLDAIEMVSQKFGCHWTKLPVDKFTVVLERMKERKRQREEEEMELPMGEK